MIDFPEIVTSAAKDGFCLLTKRAEDMVPKHDNASRESYIFTVPIVVDTTAAFVGPYFWEGCMPYRIPVGGSIAVPGPASSLLYREVGKTVGGLGGGYTRNVLERIRLLGTWLQRLRNRNRPAASSSSIGYFPRPLALRIRCEWSAAPPPGTPPRS